MTPSSGVETALCTGGRVYGHRSYKWAKHSSSGPASTRAQQPGSLGRPLGPSAETEGEQEYSQVTSCGPRRMNAPFEEVPKWLVPNYLLGSVAHVHCIINPVFQEAPGVLEVWGRVLHHHQLCCVVDASQHGPAGVPVKLQRNPPRSYHGCGGRGSSYPRPW